MFGTRASAPPMLYLPEGKSPPASKPRKKPDLAHARQDARSLSYHTKSYLPNAANEVHGNEASRKSLDEMPASVKRLHKRKCQQCNRKDPHSLVPACTRACAKSMKNTVSTSARAPRRIREARKTRHWGLPYAGLSADQVQTVYSQSLPSTSSFQQSFIPNPG